MYLETKFNHSCFDYHVGNKVWGIIFSISVTVTSTRPPHMRILVRTGQKSHHNQDRWNSHDTRSWALDLWRAARNPSLWGMTSKEVSCFYFSHDISGVMWLVHSQLMKDYKKFCNMDVLKNCILMACIL